MILPTTPDQQGPFGAPFHDKKMCLLISTPRPTIARRQDQTFRRNPRSSSVKLEELKLPYRSTKTYGHELGLSACFRQWRADSHCNQLHGYALSFKLVFEAWELDKRNWVVDFGGLKPVKSFLEDTFDHKTVVAADDPELSLFQLLAERGLIQLVVLDNVGCEAFAGHVFNYVDSWLERTGLSPRVTLLSVECREHGANSAIYC